MSYCVSFYFFNEKVFKLFFLKRSEFFIRIVFS